MAFEAGDDVWWRKASTRGRRHAFLVPATVRIPEGAGPHAGRVLVEAQMPNGDPLRRWITASRLQPRPWLANVPGTA